MSVISALQPVQLSHLIGSVVVEWNEGDVVRKLRNAFGLTLDDLAEVAGVSLTAVNRMETGRTKEAKRDTLKKIAAVFGLTSHQLLDAIPKSSVDAALTSDAARRAGNKKTRVATKRRAPVRVTKRG